MDRSRTNDAHPQRGAAAAAQGIMARLREWRPWRDIGAPAGQRIAAAFSLTLLIATPAAFAQQSNLDPGQFTGRVQIGDWSITNASFVANSTIPEGFSSSSIAIDYDDPNCPGSGWHYCLSTQAVDPNNPDPLNRIVYTVRTWAVTTLSAIGNTAHTNFPPRTGLTVNPNGREVEDFIDPSPWTLEVEVLRDGPCPGESYWVGIQSYGTDGSTGYDQHFLEGTCIDVVRGDSVPCFRSALPLLSGETGTNQHTLSGGQILLRGGGPTIPLEDLVVGPDTAYPPDANGRIFVQYRKTIPCPCANLLGGFELQGVLDHLPYLDPNFRATQTVSVASVVSGQGQNAGVTNQQFLDNNIVGQYNFGSDLQSSSYRTGVGTHFTCTNPSTCGDLSSTNFIWPFSALKNPDGTPADLPVVLPDDCTPVYRDFIAEAAFIRGTSSFRCALDPNRPSVQDLAISRTFGLLGGGISLPSYGGEATTYAGPSGGYQLIVAPGTWDACCNFGAMISNPDPGAYVNQSLCICERRSMPVVINEPGEEKLVNFGYDMGKLTARLTVSDGDAELSDPRISVNPTQRYENGVLLYQVEGSGRGVDTHPPDGTHVGVVTMYLPRGQYRMTPSATLADGSTATFPEFQVGFEGCEEWDCEVGAPAPDWDPGPDTCGLGTITVTGTAHDPDGFTPSGRIAYRVNRAGGPDPNDTSGFVPLTLTEDPNHPGDPNYVAFTSESISIGPGENTVELESVDGLGNRCWNSRRAVGIMGSGPSLFWDFQPPADPNQPVCPRTVIIQGAALGDVLLEPDITVTVTDSSGPRSDTRQFIGGGGTAGEILEQIPLGHGQNDVTVTVRDKCGRNASMTRTITQNCAPTCGFATSIQPSCGGGPGSVTLDGTPGGVVGSPTAPSDPDPEDVPLLARAWSTATPGCHIDPPAASTSGLFHDGAPVCPLTCMVDLTVTDPFGLSAACSGQATLGIPPPPGLVGWWPFDETSGPALDLAGANPGTLVPSSSPPARDPDGKVGGALSFDGVDDVVVVTEGPGLDITGAITLDAWIRTPGAAGYQGVANKILADEPRAGYLMSVTNDGRVACDFVRDHSVGDQGLAVSSTVVSDDCFHHVACTYDPDDPTPLVKVYVDGVLEASTAYAGEFGTNDEPLRIGYDPASGFGRYFEGEIDEVEVFGRALDQNEIERIFQSGGFGKCKNACVPAPPGLVSWWPADGNTWDIRGGNDGILVGGASYTAGPDEFVGRAFDLDGTTGYVEVPHRADLMPGSGSFTVDAWVFTSQTAGRQTVLEKYDCGGTTCDGGSVYELFVMNGVPSFHIRDASVPGTGQVISGTPSVPNWTLAGGWHLLVGTREIPPPPGDPDTGTFNLYVDGELVATATLNAETSGEIIDEGAELDPLIIGAASNSGGLQPPIFNHFNGSIDEVEYFNRALSLGEIRAMYLAGASGKCKDACVPPPSGLAGWWSADGHAADIQGGNDGSLMGGTSFTAGPGEYVGRAFELDGATGYVQVPHRADLMPGAGSFSVDAWVFTSETTGRQTVLEKYDCGGTTCDGGSVYELFVENGVPSFHIRDTSTPAAGQVIGGTPSDPNWTLAGGWHLLVGTREIPPPPGNPDTGTINLYVDGELVATATLNAETSGEIIDEGAELDPLIIGALSNSAGLQPPIFSHFNGSIDEVEYFNRALSLGEIRAMYLAGASGKCKPTVCLDADDDGFGAPGNPFCRLGASSDCDDADPARHPGAPDALCNGVDNDCDGAIDEDYAPQPTSCGVGACHSSGISSCTGGVESANCTPGQPVPEVCNGVDDDCDGAVDDEYVPQPTACGTGTCQRTGTTSCVGGIVQDSCVPAPGTPAPAGLVAWWSADGHTADIQGGNDGSLMGGASFTAGPGEYVGRAFELDGATGYVQVPHRADLMPGAGSFSVDAWVFTSETAGRQTVLEKYDCGGTTCDGGSVYELFVENGVPSFHIRDTSTPAAGQVIGGTPSDPNWTLAGGWHLLVGTREIPPPPGDPDTGTINLYVDGELVATTTLNAETSGEIIDEGAELDPLIIGALSNSAGLQPPIFSHFNGSIDEVEYFNRALSASEVLALYQAGTVGKCRPGDCPDLDGDGAGAPGSVYCRLGPDEDCDDADATRRPGAPDTLCNGVDNDCDLATDEDYVPQPTTCGVGACQSSGISSCTGGVESANCTPGQPSPEVCNGIDDDCDGATDDEYVPQPTTCGVGACQSSGVSSCTGGVESANCTPGQPVPEVCNGLDDDCDGAVPPDEADVDGDQYRICQSDCDDSDPDVHPGAADPCNGRNDDCDLAVDEDFASGPTTCGTGTCVRQGTTSCVAGAVQDSCLPAPGTPAPLGLVGWWPGDSHATDIQGGDDGAPVNGAGYAPGIVGDSFNVEWNPPNPPRFFAVPDSDALDFGPAGPGGGGDLSIDAWIQPRATSGIQPIVDKRERRGSPLYGYVFSLNGGSLMFQLADGQPSNLVPISPPFLMTSGNWYHVAVTVDRDDPAGGVFYVNGQPFGGPFDPTIRSGDLANTHELWIGRDSAFTSHFDGLIDEVEVFNRVLSPAEVQAIHAAGADGKCRAFPCQDGDGDFFGSPANPFCVDPSHSDCNPADPSVWARPGEVTNLHWQAGGTNTLVWDPVSDPGAASVVYDVIQGGNPNNFVTGAECVASNVTGTSAVDSTPQPAGNIRFYIVRAENGCPGRLGQAVPGRDSAGNPRAARDCP